MAFGEWKGAGMSSLLSHPFAKKRERMGHGAAGEDEVAERQSQVLRFPSLCFSQLIFDASFIFEDYLGSKPRAMESNMPLRKLMDSGAE